MLCTEHLFAFSWVCMGDNTQTVLCREDLVMKIEYPNGSSLVEDPLGSRLTTFADQKWQVQVAGFAPVSGSILEGRVDIVPGEPLALEIF